VLSFPFPEEMKQAIRDNWGAVKGKYAKLDTFLTGAEPVDKYVWFLRKEMVKWYRDNFNYRADLDVMDVLDTRKKLADMYAQYGRWDWLPSPYFVTLEVKTLRVVVRNPDGTESETFIVGDYPDQPLMAMFDTQNTIMLRLLEIRLREKELEHYGTDMVGETVGGKKIKDIVEDDYPYLYGKEKPKKKEEAKSPGKKPEDKRLERPGQFQKAFRLSRAGPYHAVFMESVAAIILKEITQSTFAQAKGYFRSALGVP
jgi:hypothetical protein